MYDQVRIILIHSTHPGNIGSTARAMKNMGFSQLWLVAPKTFPAKEADYMASHADDILQNTQVVSSFAEATKDCEWIFGLSARDRKIAWPTFSVREGMQKAVEKCQANPNFKMGIVFGNEQSGLPNEILEKCHFQINIPTSTEYSSLNLAHAVLVAVYELRMEIEHSKELKENNHETKNNQLQYELKTDELPATAAELENFYLNLEYTLKDIGFLTAQSTSLMMRLRRLFGRSNLDKTEINILRGILKTVAREKLLRDEVLSEKISRDEIV